MRKVKTFYVFQGRDVDIDALSRLLLRQWLAGLTTT
jgi:hypothetical protein